MNVKTSKEPKARTQPVTTPGHQTSVFQSWWFLVGVTMIGAAVILVGLRQLNREVEVPEIEFKVIAEYPHDSRAFTQGLVYHDGALYESTGRYGESTLRQVEIESGKVLQQTDLSPDLFGEGLCLWDNEWRQLTWEANVVLHYDKETLLPSGESEWKRQGWGLAQDGQSLIISDGTYRLFFVDPENNQIRRSIDVTSGDQRIDRINELEYVDGFLYANVWYKTYILKIDPSNGKVVGKIELGPVIQEMQLADRDAVCNGIAYNPDSGRFFVTGKLWPKVFEIELATD